MIIDTIKSNFKIIFFGFVFTFASSVGQSFFIGLFNSDIRSELNISHSQFGSIYGIATLCSSIVLIWLGKKIDDFKLVYYSIFVVFLLSTASLFFSYVNGPFLLLIGIFLLRLSGQGLMSHTSTTAVSRYFEKRRGKALSIIWLGMSLGEFLLPILIVFLLSFLYWRDLWIYITLTILIFLPAISFYTTKHIYKESREKKTLDKEKKFNLIKSWKRKEVLKDFKFYTILPCILAPAFIITGIVINQSFIIESKSWGTYTLAKAFMSYSVLTVITLFIAGILIDKFTSKKLLIYLNLPMFLGLLILIFFNNPFSAFIFMGLIGISNGLTNLLVSSLWAEIYGVNYLGAIKALTGALMVFSTALATTVFGFLIDFDYSIENISFICVIYIVISTLIVAIFQKTYNPILTNKT
ncbi:MFS transporter [bacterium]|nr:MFS transporter [bacterium]